jgi:hypothetical protein
MPLAWSRVYAGGGYEDVPPATLYGNAEHNQEVVETLLAPLVDRKATGERASP